MRQPNEPTPEQCSARAVLPCGGRACWYPQMGGYGAKAVVYVDHCTEVYVWHDGEFPFSEGTAPGRRPAYLHHCSGTQFEEFGAMLREMGCE